MESQICYCAVDGKIAGVRNHDNTAGAKPPEFAMGLPCELRLRLFANCEDATPYPPSRFSGIAGWGFVMDTDFSRRSTVKLVADNTDIRVDEVVDGGATYTQIAIPIASTYTAELAAALDGKECLALVGELIGYDSGHAEVFVLQIKGFTVRGRVADSGEPVPMPTAAYQTMAQELVNAAVTSGGLISSGAVTGMINASALPKNLPFSTTVGGYTVELTSGGGFSVYGSGASVTLSGGSVGISAAGAIKAQYDNAYLGASGWVSVGYGGVTAGYGEAFEASTSITQAGNVVVSADGWAIVSAAGGITANGSAITQVSSAFYETSLGIDTLSGGVKYVCQSALTALSIGSAAAGCNAAILFKMADGGILTPPANLPLFGEMPTSAGVTYCLSVNGDFAVCAPAIVEAQ